MENEYDKRIDEIITELQEITKGANRSFILITGELSSDGRVHSRTVCDGTEFLLGATINGLLTDGSSNGIPSVVRAFSERFYLNEIKYNKL